MIEKLKKLNKKWYLLLVLIILLGGCGGAVKYYFRQQFQKNMQANAGVQMVRSVEQDLLYLDNNSTLKLSPDQAKAILPLVEEMSNSDANSSTSINDLAKQVYESLTSGQYQELIQFKNPVGNVEKERGVQDNNQNHRREDKHQFEDAVHFTKNMVDPKAEALKDIVIKMLKERSAENTKNLAS